jgi:hypothetical protein
MSSATLAVNEVNPVHVVVFRVLLAAFVLVRLAVSIFVTVALTGTFSGLTAETYVKVSEPLPPSSLSPAVQLAAPPISEPINSSSPVPPVKLVPRSAPVVSDQI